MVAPGAAGYSRKQIDELGEQAKALGARGLYTVKVAAEGVTSALEKTLGAAGVQAIVAATGAKAGRPDPGRFGGRADSGHRCGGADRRAIAAGDWPSG